MSRRTVGLTMVGVGALLVIVGAISLITSSGSEQVASSPTTTTTPRSTTTSLPAPTSTTTFTPTTTSTTSTTTTTTVAPPSVTDFVEAYAAAVEQGDADFLFDRLLPDLTGAFGEQLCRGWIEREILALSDYEITGDITGPLSRTLSVGDTAIPVENYFEGPVSFTFQGQSFDAQAAWVIADGQVYWVGECR